MKCRGAFHDLYPLPWSWRASFVCMDGACAHGCCMLCQVLEVGLIMPHGRGYAFRVLRARTDAGEPHWRGLVSGRLCGTRVGWPCGMQCCWLGECSCAVCWQVPSGNLCRSWAGVRVRYVLTDGLCRPHVNLMGGYELLPRLRQAFLLLFVAHERPWIWY